GLNPTTLRITLPDFHNLSLRYGQLLTALKSGNAQRISASKAAIRFIQQQEDIVRQFETLQKDPSFRSRITHHDTKISNILFDPGERSVCVIDTDTMMPGYFISDLGDMMRTYLPPVSEEEKDFDNIIIREDIYQAIVQGYCSSMNAQLTDTEKAHF